MERLTDNTGMLLACNRGFCCSLDIPSCAECRHLDESNAKLAVYEDAEEQGRLIRLPCKIGETVIVAEKQLCSQCYNVHYRFREDAFCYEHIAQIGETVFLTRAEAEAALTKQKGE